LLLNFESGLNTSLDAVNFLAITVSIA